jgi:hypothetical protein
MPAEETKDQKPALAYRFFAARRENLSLLEIIEMKRFLT